MIKEETVTLKEHFYELRKADKEAVALALTAAEKAVAVAERNAEKWRDNANEWRQAMMDRESKFMHQAEFNAYKESVQMALGVEKSRGDRGEGRGAGLHQGWILLIGLVSLVGGIIAIGSRFTN